MKRLSRQRFALSETEGIENGVQSGAVTPTEFSVNSMPSVARIELKKQSLG